MTFEVPKISQGEFNIFSRKMNPVGMPQQKVSFGGSNIFMSGGSTGLDEVKRIGDDKAINERNGLGGAPTPCEGIGKHLWAIG